MKSENVFGESFGKTSALANNGEIPRGFDSIPQEKYKSMAQASYLNQRQLIQEQRAAEKKQLQNP